VDHKYMYDMQDSLAECTANEILFDEYCMYGARICINYTYKAIAFQTSSIEYEDSKVSEDIFSTQDDYYSFLAYPNKSCINAVVRELCNGCVVSHKKTILHVEKLEEYNVLHFVCQVDGVAAPLEELFDEAIVLFILGFLFTGLCRSSISSGMAWEM